MNQREAQQAADRIRNLRDELATFEVRSVLSLTPEQQTRFDEWSRTRLGDLAGRFDVDTSGSQKRLSWVMRIASTLGGLALCTSVVLLFQRYWGYLDTAPQVVILIAAPLAGLALTEVARRRERTLYFTGLLALVTLALFILDLSVLGTIFNIVSTERALLAWGLFAMLIAYRHGLRLQLAAGLLLLISYAAATVTASLGYRWLDFGERPELTALLGLAVFVAPSAVMHRTQEHFPPVYRAIGSLVFFVAVLSLAEWGIPSLLPLSVRNVGRLYEVIGLVTSAGAIWLGISRQWSSVVNIASFAFAFFLLARFYHWWWDWMPRFLFFALIGAIGILMVMAFRRLRAGLTGGVPA